MIPQQNRLWWEREDLCYKDGNLVFSGKSAAGLINVTGTPAFFYSANRISQNLERLQEALSQLDSYQIYYAIKANRFAPILTHIKKTGLCGVDICSPNELLHAFSCGFTCSEISYTAHAMTNDELRLLADNPDVRLNCDSLSTIRRLGQFCSHRKIGIRVNPAMGIGYRDSETLRYSGDKTTKFGVYREQFEEALALASKHGLIVDTIHFHTGCGYLNNQLSIFDEILEATHWFTDKVKDLASVNLGGGLGVPHDEDDVNLDLDSWVSVINKHYGGKGLTVCVEPGDYVVKDSGILILEVNTVERKQQTDFIGVNGGFNLAIEPAFYGLPCEPVVLEQKTDTLKPVTIAGNINESLDVWKDNFPMPDQIKEGDLLAFINAGGYASSMMSNHCMRGQVSENIVF
ncbi:Diaminopimelate decarboxylase [Desulfatibacillum aliphaticivorans]|uniref:Diaminopimelate decarboxylase n=1 Tax=Desulfatibacillum aliphaticivorans TaxID=218208 RepID=B8FLY1_DESAL|nr:diaminopimelate decarboxylase [Desulfatibacillum aliphaticivorans]ACL05714.1 Diaminopimelate decarboxylase [Desulfatibacillum aliphaticivorans]